MENSEPIRFLDDSSFFKQHLGQALVENRTPRPTTQPLVEIRHQESHSWIGLTFVPWLANCSGVGMDQMAEFRTCLSEVFNNISDHTELDVGSIFAQWFPNERRLEVCLADFGPGIPATVSRVRPGLSDTEAVMLAFEDGFSSQSLPTNRGVGLHYLQQNVVQNLGGRLTCQSASGGVRIEKIGNLVRKVPYTFKGFCPGTLIEISFATDRMSEFEEEGDFSW